MFYITIYLINGGFPGTIDMFSRSQSLPTVNLATSYVETFADFLNMV